MMCLFYDHISFHQSCIASVDNSDIVVTFITIWFNLFYFCYCFDYKWHWWLHEQAAALGLPPFVEVVWMCVWICKWHLGQLTYYNEVRWDIFLSPSLFLSNDVTRPVRVMWRALNISCKSNLLWFCCSCEQLGDGSKEVPSGSSL